MRGRRSASRSAKTALFRHRGGGPAGFQAPESGLRPASGPASIWALRQRADAAAIPAAKGEIALIFYQWVATDRPVRGIAACRVSEAYAHSMGFMPLGQFCFLSVGVAQQRRQPRKLAVSKDTLMVSSLTLPIRTAGRDRQGLARLESARRVHSGRCAFRWVHRLRRAS